LLIYCLFKSICWNVQCCYINSTASTYVCMLCGVWTNILQDPVQMMLIDDLQVNKQDVIIHHSSQKEYKLIKYHKSTFIHHFRNYKRLLHNKMKLKDYKHHCLGHGSPSTIFLSLGRGGFVFFVLVDVLGLGLEDCGLSGVEGGSFGGSSSSEEV
jgi:hypothetical protein